jgi:peptidoglycan/LPS O-acetylase OafA/YrhL
MQQTVKPFNGFRFAKQAIREGGFYHAELDVVRFFAFVAVFLHHALPAGSDLYTSAALPTAAVSWLLAVKDAGAYGVDLFFTLSSYLITELLIREHQAKGTLDIRAFYIRRALRIWPLYFVFLGATVFLVPLILPDDRFNASYAVSFALLSGNWVCAIEGLPFSVASPLWSISVEEQFYLAWPLLLLLFGVGRIRKLAFVMLGIALAVRTLLAVYEIGHPGVWCNTLARLDPIALGALLAVTLGGRAPRLNTVYRIALGVASLTLFVIVGKYLKQDGLDSLITYPLVAIASVTLLVAALHTDAAILRRRPFSWLVYLGRISYGLYIFHLFSLTLVSKQSSLLGIPLNFERRFVLSFVITVILAAASYRFLERPFLRLKDRFTHIPTHSAVSNSQASVALPTASATAHPIV